MLELPDIDNYCSKSFQFRDFFECSDTYKIFLPSNIPVSIDTYSAITNLANEILERVIQEFGDITLTYGFCGPALQRLIKQKIDSKIDQHAGHELDLKGNLICKRKGFAVDFIVKNKCSLDVSRWIVNNCRYDRLYFYGSNRPVHISYSDSPIEQIVLMKFRNTRVVPQRIKKHDFLNTKINF